MKVFVSHSAEDREVAKELASGLANAGFKTWDPAEALFPGDNWASEIGKALQESDAMVVLISPDSMKSDWVRHEVDYALGSARFKGRLIPVIVKPTKDIPWILKRFPLIQLGQDLPGAVRQITGYIKHGFELAPANS